MTGALHDEAGLSMIEMLVTMLIMGVVIASITGLFVSGIRAEVQMNERFQAQVNARTAMDKLRRDVHCAEGATVTETPASSTSSVVLQNTCVDTARANVTWCTQASANGFALHRAVAGACSAASAMHADHLTTWDVFEYVPPSDQSLARLRVDLPVQLESMQVPYRLCDQIALRNAWRNAATATGTLTACP
ncbi:MAG TPA: type II secretion system protein [Gaiellaceae bacterium]|nr:type II secretion system protein [Gaiellaceae bacterium]